MRNKNISGLKLIRKFVQEVWPVVDMKLDEYIKLAKQSGDSVLSTQALSSIQNKRFHALGGSVYALYPGADITNTVNFITALQTISDYLDNLCDRAGVEDEQAFRQLHMAVLDAVEPSADLSDYYLYYPYKSDNGYLKTLVEECRSEVLKVPSYGLVKGKIKQLAELYSNLQVYKHLNKEIREEKLTAWANSHLKEYPDIYSMEFCAAAGSTLGIFMLFAAAHNPKLTEAQANLIYSSYFPWITGLHILLDYFIDSDEDITGGDLNFTHYYSSMGECKQRLTYFVKRSARSCRKLEYPAFHLTMVRGLLAMYLSDPKASSAQSKKTARALLKISGCKTLLYHCLCGQLRRRGKL